ncbi:selenocysteine lyase [Corynebacterium kutscheri]|uniref:Selenocysteine lyase n=1 Tax=Corynebacterium kutscheri TaxID=35755 RepID=A0A0F6TCE5_9CORY|nr:aminotransferase class V-fold PLP-dependent enzyme [Corynebacterium kutscheri]AKE40321.1 selenocysteine lyase [Corynebacterium kutscheri]VEH10714.1 cysteine desulfurase [Corynebacterium kutscheri]
MSFDVARVRGLYTSLSDGWVYLNADSSPQIPESVSAATARAFRNAPLMDNSQSTGTHAKNQLTLGSETMVATARRAIADLTGTVEKAVFLGPSLETIYHRLSIALAPLLRHGGELISTRTATHTLDVPVHRYAENDLGTGEIPAWQYRDLVTGGTRLVTISSAHPQVGTVNNIAEIADITHSQSRAWVLVDATACAGMRDITFNTLGADIITVDCAAFGGPHIAAVAFRDVSMFPRMYVETLRMDVAPGLAGGVSAAIDHLADLDEDALGTRKKRLKASLAASGQYLERLGNYLVDSLSVLPKIHLLGISGELASGAHVDRLPRVSFIIEGVPDETIFNRLLSHGLVASMTRRDALLEAMGIDDTQGALTIGLHVYNTTNDIDQLVRTMASLA